MAEATTADDAPLATSKRSDATDRAIEGLIDGKGDSFAAFAVTINRPRREVYDRFRDFAALADVFENVERIDVIDATHTHWVVNAPAGKTVEWDATTTEDVPGERIAWSSAEGADIANSGRVEFRDATGGRGTVVSATILYDPPAGAIGKLVAKLFQREPNIQVRRDLRRFKQLLETGEISTNVRNPAQLEAEGK